MKYGLTEKEWGNLGLGLVSCLADQLVADGKINPKGKSKLQLAKEAVKKIRKLHAQGIEFSMMETHDDELLQRARTLAKKGDHQEACLFYATWFEHWVNFVLTRERFRLKEDERLQMVRETSLVGKFHWLLPGLGLKRIPTSYIKTIRRVAEARNAFVHFKYRTNIDDAKIRETRKLVTLERLAEKTVRYLRDYEDKYIYHEIRGFVERTSKTSSAKK